MCKRRRLLTVSNLLNLLSINEQISIIKGNFKIWQQKICAEKQFAQFMQKIRGANNKEIKNMAAKNEKRQFIKIRGANEHNLKNIDLDIPRNELVVLTGLSGSGKSSLAFDTIYAEGQRRYMESLSSYARQFLGQMEKPDVESIEGLSPAISIDQKSTNRNPRSTVGTVTEIYDYFTCYMRESEIPTLSKCGREIKKQTVDRMVDRISWNCRSARRSSSLLQLSVEEKDAMKSFWRERRKADMYVCVWTVICMNYPKRSH